MFISISSHTVFYFSPNFQTTRHCAEQWSHGVLTKRSLNLSEIQKPTAGPLKKRRFRSLETIVVSGYLSFFGGSRSVKIPFFLLGRGMGKVWLNAMCFLFKMKNGTVWKSLQFHLGQKTRRNILVGSKESWLAGNLQEFKPGNGQINRPGCILESRKVQRYKERCATNVSKLAWYPKRYFYNGTTKI